MDSVPMYTETESNNQKVSCRKENLFFEIGYLCGEAETRYLNSMTNYNNGC